MCFYLNIGESPLLQKRIFLQVLVIISYIGLPNIKYIQWVILAKKINKIIKTNWLTSNLYF